MIRLVRVCTSWDIIRVRICTERDTIHSPVPSRNRDALETDVAQLCYRLPFLLRWPLCRSRIRVRPTLLETVTRFLFCHRNPLFHHLFVRRLLLRFYDYADIDFDIHRQTAAAALSLRVKSIVMTRPSGLLTSTSSAYLSVRLLLRENVTFMFSMLHLADLCPRHLCLFASSAECPGQKSDSPEYVIRKEARLSLNSTDRRVTSTFTIVFPLRCGTINVRLLPIDCSAHRSDDRFVPSNQPLYVPEVYPTRDQCNHRIHVRIQLSPYTCKSTTFAFTTATARSSNLEYQKNDTEQFATARFAGSHAFK